MEGISLVRSGARERGEAKAKPRSQSFGHAVCPASMLPARMTSFARVGEQFRFRVPLSLPATAAAALEVRLTSGGRLPKFVRSDFVTTSPRQGTSGSSSEGRGKRCVELSGVPGYGDLGELSVGVYERGTVGECVGRAILQIVERS